MLFDRNTERQGGIFFYSAKRDGVGSLPPRRLDHPLSFHSFHKLVSRTETRFTATQTPWGIFPLPKKEEGATLATRALRFPDPCHLLSEVRRSSKRGQTEAWLVSHWLETCKLHVPRTDRVWFQRVDVRHPPFGRENEKKKRSNLGSNKETRSCSAIRTRGCTMQHCKLYASSPQQLLCMHSGVRLFSIKPPGNWPIVWLRVPSAWPALGGFPFGEGSPFRWRQTRLLRQVAERIAKRRDDPGERLLTRTRKGEAREEVVPTPVDRSALGWNQACLSSYINYALNTRTPTWC